MLVYSLALRGKDVDSERSKFIPHVASTWREDQSRRTQGRTPRGAAGPPMIVDTGAYYLNLVTYTFDT
jgi:hypothetical protein